MLKMIISAIICIALGVIICFLTGFFCEWYIDKLKHSGGIVKAVSKSIRFDFKRYCPAGDFHNRCSLDTVYEMLIRKGWPASAIKM